MEKKRDFKLAYLAGVLDGDGSFSIIKRTFFSEAEKRRIPRYRPCIQMYNLSDEMTKSLEENLGGNIGTRNKQKEEWLPQYYWYCVGLKSCKIALDKLLPYLVVKKEMAEGLLKFSEKAINLYQKKRLEDFIIQDREKDYLAMRMLNDKRDLSPESVCKRSHEISKNQIDWAYIAGLMDTDGSFQISRSIRTCKKSYGYEARATIQMLSIKGINFIYEKSGLGHVALITRGRGSNCRQLFHYRWIITNHHELKIFINNILPYISFKKEQCLVLLEFIDKYNVDRTEEQKNIRDYFYNKIKNLNKYGVLKPSLIDLEAQEQGDKAEGESRGDRLSEMDAICVCDSQDTSNSST